jgi:N-[(2S)-2-amino-2-carboxyethyl]-L-glutamate dehydrogenase
VQEDELLILTGQDVLSVLENREEEIMRAVRLAYEAHGKGLDDLPHSVFLRFPNEPKNRIIALPAYLGDEFHRAGLKWIASFPGNKSRGLDRASAVIILNSAETGRPQAILEGSIISAKRTAASAALAARHLHGDNHPTAVSLIGCGLINFEIVRFLLKVFPEIKRLTLFDTNQAHARRFGQKCSESFGEVRFEVAADMEAAFSGASLVSLATTASAPHIDELPPHADKRTILHVSLRDLAPKVILSGDNVVDDVDHVCRAGTSLHLTEQLVGNRDFIRCTIADILLNRATAQVAGDNGTTIFSPFGLGVLDLAVSALVLELASGGENRAVVKTFFPASWTER